IRPFPFRLSASRRPNGRRFRCPTSRPTRTRARAPPSPSPTPAPRRRADPMKRRFLTALTVAVALTGALAGGVYAYWKTSGSGSGSASTGTLQPVTVAAFVGGDAPSSVLVPGGSSADVILRVNNTNPFPVTLVSVTGNGTITADSGFSGCTTTGVTFTSQSGLADAI